MPEELGGDWFDYDRTTQLVDNVYQYRGIRSREILPDNSTDNVPLQYYLLTAKLAMLANIMGDEEASARYGEMAADFLVVYRGGTKARRSE